ncbi:TetR/AcrR family transcriptional regulator [Kibdelosporangium persicum]|uniref:DNA-binding transcriptional regulator, AcrR family n=1 Tax=Kibdelosporangium persicum TaxID=2698649 RepID=A0ABX2EX77_9PSEU|nr:TetR/AcrR family transcriptional regulator [Kibdelosporangium persicum]NRN63298.1 DNA-binding transcriptional regulator, AcrR family [Kibdelosporangium persicum]
MADDLKDRILDAAVECLLESHPGARVHAAIAERAGVSRPTVYKYVGDQDAIVMALMERDIARMHAAAASVVTRSGSLRERFLDTIVFVVGYARDHRLLQKALREDPASILPWFTVNSEPVIEMGIGLFGPHVKQAIADGEFPAVDPRVIVEWCCRLILSLITTPGTIRTDDPAALRRYLEDLLDIGMPR